MAVNTVNILKQPPYFQSRRENYSNIDDVEPSFVNNKKTLRRGIGSQC
jgi:hypothetical protein